MVANGGTAEGCGVAYLGDAVDGCHGIEPECLGVLHAFGHGEDGGA